MPAGGDKGDFGGKTGEQPDAAVIVREDAGIKGELFPAFFAPDLARGVVDFAVEFVLSGGGVADGDADFSEEVKGII